MKTLLSTRKLKSAVVFISLLAAFLLALLLVGHIVATVTYRGLAVVASNFPRIFFDIPAVPGVREVGGVGPHLLGTALLVTIAFSIGVPISLLAAIFTAESLKPWERKLGKMTRLMTHMLIEFPTIVVGLSVYGIMSALTPYMKTLIPGFKPFSLLSGAVALFLVSVPYMYAQIEDGLKSIPQHVREAVYSLGAGRLLTSYILLKYLKSTVYAALSIGLARMVSETAALFFTAFGSDVYPLFDIQMLFRPIGSLTLAVYYFGLTGYENWVDLSWAASFILFVLSLVLFIASRLLLRGR
ncbi:MAG: ABC transporter permease subunit [Sulfolobales archaeon]|nr:ABC transporter permease subunit [Sulfolobales archaeon]MDW8082432.1 ABC transporter permease subunit [Sulfolobales archaeon]